MNSATTHDQRKQQLLEVYKKSIEPKMSATSLPFFARFAETYEGRRGVLFVGKAENVEWCGRGEQTLDWAFKLIDNDYINEITCERTPRKNNLNAGAYVRTMHKLAKEFEKRGITCFARTNLYKLSDPRDWKFIGENDADAYFDIFLKELELLQPKYVILLTSGVEEPFLAKFNKPQDVVSPVNFTYFHKGPRQRQFACRIFANKNSVFVTALHPQGKPDMIKPIMELIDKAGAVMGEIAKGS